MRLVLVILVAGAALAASGCDSGSGPPRPGAKRVESTRATREDPRQTRPGPRVITRSTRYGRIVADGNGRTLYVFTRETSARSGCYAQCAKAWPPLLARGKPSAGHGARARLLGTTRRRGGSVQVTYRGHPLYYYIGDHRPGEVLCQNVVEFGGTWLVADASGQPVR